MQEKHVMYGEVPYSGKFWRPSNLAKWLYFDIGEI